MNGIDTNILVRFFMQDNTSQFNLSRQFLLMECSRSQPGYINTIVLCELIWTLKRTYKLKREQLILIIEQLLDVEQAIIEEQDLVRRALKDFRFSKADFADCLIGQKNLKAGCKQTITFDRSAATLDSFERLG